MDQTFVNWIIGLCGVVIGILLTSLMTSVKDLQTADKEMDKRISEVEVLVAGNYVTTVELDKVISALFKKLDAIDTKLDLKANKSECAETHRRMQ